MRCCCCRLQQSLVAFLNSQEEVRRQLTIQLLMEALWVPHLPCFESAETPQQQQQQQQQQKMQRAEEAEERQLGAGAAET